MNYRRSIVAAFCVGLVMLFLLPAAVPALAGIPPEGVGGYVYNQNGTAAMSGVTVQVYSKTGNADPRGNYKGTATTDSAGFWWVNIPAYGTYVACAKKTGFWDYWADVSITRTTGYGMVNEYMAPDVYSTKATIFAMYATVTSHTAVQMTLVQGHSSSLAIEAQTGVVGGTFTVTSGTINAYSSTMSSLVLQKGVWVHGVVYKTIKGALDSWVTSQAAGIFLMTTYTDYMAATGTLYHIGPTGSVTQTKTDSYSIVLNVGLDVSVGFSVGVPPFAISVSQNYKGTLTDTDSSSYSFTMYWKNNDGIYHDYRLALESSNILHLWETV